MATKSTQFHNRIAKEYEKSYQTPYWNLYHDITWQHIKKYLPKSRKYPVLDAGGGTGYWARKIAKLGFDVICTDVAKKMLKAGEKMIKSTPLAKRITFVYSDIINMKEFKDSSFSMAIAEGDPVGYCCNPKKAIKELARVARKGAPIIVSVDGFFATITGLIKRKDFKQLPILLKTHIVNLGNFPQYNFTVSELRQLYSKSNINVKGIIGKPVFINNIEREERNKLLADKNFYKRALKLELQFNSDPSLIGLAPHIEIVGIRD